ncbi:thiamine-phosphate kinase [Ferrimicrobium acidiphilum]|uniref:thiamine-phosphate kinase n=1 Tax=Ferrimicrobium acidiphilum TaxID=121039 RepID=UPI0023F2A0A6|nr:thiamine-phosphate kinase [Ferrimicrobium acidiphilum]
MDRAWDELATAEGIARRATWDTTGKILGDDAAVVPDPGAPLTICADALVEGIHFDLRYWTPTQIGSKAVTVNISDLAAMAAQPLWVLSTIAAPKHFDVDRLLEGIEAGAARYGARLIGGDLTRAETVVISVTAIGSQLLPPLRRSGALPDDTVFVTGPLGLASVALERLSGAMIVDERTRLALLDPSARLNEGFAASRAGASAAIDISDGFALDLHRLANASGVGFEISHLPVAEGATRRDALGGGEDYELLFTAPDPSRVAEEFAKLGIKPPLMVGTVLADPEQRTLEGEPLDPIGYRH